jgi:hypothetical protein
MRHKCTTLLVAKAGGPNTLLRLLPCRGWLSHDYCRCCVQNHDLSDEDLPLRYHQIFLTPTLKRLLFLLILVRMAQAGDCGASGLASTMLHRYVGQLRTGSLRRIQSIWTENFPARNLIRRLCCTISLYVTSKLSGLDRILIDLMCNHAAATRATVTEHP